MGRWTVRLGVAVALAVVAAYVGEDSAGAITEGRLRPPRSAAQSQSEDHIVVQAPADPAIQPPPPVPRGPDPDLEPGFPVQTFHSAGSYYGGPAVHTLVGNIDLDSTLEIVVTGLANGPLYAWNSDGSTVAGWPVTSLAGVGYPAMGVLSLSSSMRPIRLKLFSEVFSGHIGGSLADLGAWFGNGTSVRGWPRNSVNFVSSPASLADLDGDGIDEIFIGEEDYQLHGYRASGESLPGWPVLQALGNQRRGTPAIADLDGDGVPEILTGTGSGIGGTHLLAYHGDGSVVGGFPVALWGGYVQTFPVVGDVDGDDAPEIVVVTSQGTPPYRSQVRIFSPNGTVERTVTAADSVAYGTAPALADLDGDGVPEIIVQTDSALDVWKGDGSSFPGWPQVWSTGYWLGNSSPVVGDVDGDGQPDIVVTTTLGGSSQAGEVRVYDRFGNLHPRFPKTVPIGMGAVPAISDIDRDGRNEIIVMGSFWNGISGMFDQVWVYDLGGGPHGLVLWGQFMGGPRHRGCYP